MFSNLLRYVTFVALESSESSVPPFLLASSPTKGPWFQWVKIASQMKLWMARTCIKQPLIVLFKYLYRNKPYLMVSDLWLKDHHCNMMRQLKLQWKEWSKQSMALEVWGILVLWQISGWCFLTSKLHSTAWKLCQGSRRGIFDSVKSSCWLLACKFLPQKPCNGTSRQFQSRRRVVVNERGRSYTQLWDWLLKLWASQSTQMCHAHMW